MSGLVVPPEQLRAFAGACCEQAGEIAGFGGDAVGSGVAGDLPSTRTAGTVTTSGDDVASAMQTLAGRLREMADAPLPQVDLGEIEMPLPDGNVADTGDRCNLITQDTLPAYQDPLANLRDLLPAGGEQKSSLEQVRRTGEGPHATDPRR